MLGRKISASLIEEFIILNIKEQKSFSGDEILAYYTSGMDYITGFDVSYVIDGNHDKIFNVLAEAIAEFYNLGCKVRKKFSIEGFDVEFARTPADRFINTFVSENKQHHQNNDIGYFQIFLTKQ